MCVTWHVDNPTSVSAPSPWEENEVSTCSMREVPEVHSPALALKRDILAMGDQHTLQILILLRIFSFLWVKHCSNHCLIGWVLLGGFQPIEGGVGWGLWAPTSGGLRCYDLCCPPLGGNPLWGLEAASSCSTLSDAFSASTEMTISYFFLLFSLLVR